MSYISADVVRKNRKEHVIVWERNEQDKRVVKLFKPPLYYFKRDPNGAYKSIFNERLSKIECNNSYEYNQQIRQLRNNPDYYEIDIQPQQRVLADNYYGAEAPPLHITFLDIEVDYNKDIGFANADSYKGAYAPINSIALDHYWSKERILICVPPEGQEWNVDDLYNKINEVEQVPGGVEIYLCENEHELLKVFITLIQDSDVLAGWNCIPVNQNVWEKSKIAPIKNVSNSLYNSHITKKSNIVSKPLYLVNLANGLTIPCSGEHRFKTKQIPSSKYTTLTYTNRNKEYLKEDDIQAKDLINEGLTSFIEINVRTNNEPGIQDISNEQLYLTGLIYTDGTLKVKGSKSGGFLVFQSDYTLLKQLPLVETNIVGPHKNCFSRGVKYSLIGDICFQMIYTPQGVKHLNIELLSQLSHEQFLHFLSGIMDGDGYYAAGNIEICNYNPEDLNTLAELCLWNGIMITLRKNVVRLINVDINILFIKKHKRWNNKKTTTLTRNSNQKAKDIKFKKIKDNYYVRVTSVERTGDNVDMMDIETDTHYFVTKGATVHNSDFFDLPYIGWRLIMMDEQISGLEPYPVIKDKSNRPYWSGKTYAKEYQHRLKWFCKLSFPEANPPSPNHIVKVRQKNTGQMLDRTTIHLHGRIKADYLDLFKKYEMAERPSYKLESIADEVLPTLRKMEYQGSLADLYRTNFPYFVRYNIRDTEILSGFEDKLGYVALANTMYHISCGTFDNVLGTIKLAELAIQNYCHHELHQRVPSAKEVELPKNEQGETEGIAGAFVLDPKVGMHEWIGSIDINSLYPSSIRSINISPEMLIGQFRETTEACEEISKSLYKKLVFDYDDEMKSAETHTAEEWRDILKENKWAVSGYGTVFDQHKKGIIPTILEEWFATRKKYQKMMREETDKDKKSYYDRLQYVYKIKLNSLYGSLTNPFFKFFDLRMGESTTGTGRVILLHQCAKANEMLLEQYDSQGEAVIYGDTDSTYFKTYAENEEEAILVADTVAERVNNSFQKFMQNTFLCQPEFDNIIKAGREIVASRGIFVKKKRYILRVVDSEGTKVDKLKVMGLDTKKTIIPKEVGDQLNEFIGRLLRGEEWDTIAKDIVDFKEYIRTTDDIMAIGLPKGVQKVEYYTSEFYGSITARLPGHVAAAIHYNLALEQHGDKTNEPIKSGMKLKVFYLTEKHGRFKSIALPTDINEVPEWFVDYYTIDREAHVQRLVDKPLSSILNAAGINLPNVQSIVVNSLLDF